MAELSKIAVLGAGHLGPVIARLAIKAGYPVAIATSGDPADIALITELVIPGAQPRWAADAVADADIVVLAIPLHRFGDLDPGLDGQPGDDRPEMTRAEHREPAALRHQNPTTWRTRTM